MPIQPFPAGLDCFASLAMTEQNAALSTSLRGALATKQSRPSSTALDCFASLAMTESKDSNQGFVKVFPAWIEAFDQGELLRTAARIYLFLSRVRVIHAA